MIRKLIWFLLLLFFGLFIYFFKEYNRKPADLKEAKPAFNVSVQDIVSEFDNSEDAANKKYAGKIIEVKGLITNVVYKQDTLSSITLGEGMHGVCCTLDRKHFIKSGLYREKDTITVKGICTGYLLDVEMNRCVVVMEIK